MFNKILDYMANHPIISTIFMLFFIVALYILYLFLNATLDKSSNISERVSGISDVVGIIAIPSIAISIRALNKTFKEKFNLKTDKDEKKKHT